MGWFSCFKLHWISERFWKTDYLFKAFMTFRLTDIYNLSGPVPEGDKTTSDEPRTRDRPFFAARAGYWDLFPQDTTVTSSSPYKMHRFTFWVHSYQATWWDEKKQHTKKKPTRLPFTPGKRKDHVKAIALIHNCRFGTDNFSQLWQVHQ